MAPIQLKTHPSVNYNYSKVLIDDNKRAYGVLFAHDGQQLTAKATKEVILSAGAVNSPKLLMLSGIGPRWHLEQHGVSTV